MSETFVFCHVWCGIINELKVHSNLEELKEEIIAKFSKEGFNIHEEEAEIRNNLNETVFSYNRFKMLVQKLEELPFPFYNVTYEKTVDKGYIFKAEMRMSRGTIENVRVLAEIKIDSIDIKVKREGDTYGSLYDTIHHL